MAPVFRLGDPATAFLRPIAHLDSEALANEPDLKYRCRQLFNNEFESDIVFVVGKVKSQHQVSSKQPKAREPGSQPVFLHALCV